MFERFTDRARRVVVLAQEQARTLRHPYIGTEHLLLGLLEEGDGRAARALTDLGVDYDQAVGVVRAVVGTGEEEPGNPIPFTPPAKRALERALREALTLGHQVIDTEHLLLGVAAEPEGPGRPILERLGVDPDQLHTHVVHGLRTQVGRASLRMELGVRPSYMREESSEHVWSAPVDRLDDDVLRVVLAARDEARRHGQAEVEPEHLFVGLLTLPDGPVAALLANAGIHADPVRAALRTATAITDPVPPPAPDPTAAPTEPGSVAPTPAEAASTDPAGASPQPEAVAPEAAAVSAGRRVPRLSPATVQLLNARQAQRYPVLTAEQLLWMLVQGSNAVRLLATAAGGDLDKLRM